MQRMKRILFSGLIALFVLFGLILPQGVEARDIIINDDPVETTLAMDPSTATATTCGTVDVNVWVDDVVNLTAFHLEVTYDRTKVQVTNVVNAGLLTAPGMTELYEPTNANDVPADPTGRLLFGMAQQGTDGNPVPKSGSGNLIKITLKSLATSGTATLAIDGTKSMLVDWPDAQEIGYTVAGSTTVTLQSCAPTDITLDNAAVDENQPVATLVGTLGAIDPDAADTTFTYSLVNLASYPDNASFQIDGNELQTNAIFDFETDASYNVMIRATGPNGLTYAEEFTITVNDINDAPVLAAIANATIPELMEFDFTATATDVDLPAQVLTFSLVGAPTGAAITPAGAFTWTPTEAQGPGVYTFTVKVCDNGTPALCDEQEVTLTVTEDNIAPVAQVQSVETAEDTALDITLVATDADGNTLTYAIVAGPDHGSVTLAGNVATYTPTANFNGTDTFTYKANDGLADSNVATVTITVTAVNDAPLLALIGPQIVANTDTLTLTPSASDVDGDTLSWTLGAGAPAGATIDPATGAFSWAPGTTTPPGNYSATICVSDGTFQDCETVTINVTDGVAPILTSVTPPEGNVYLKAGEHFVLTVDALDDNLRELEIDHSMQGGGLPEFSVYASESDPYGGDAADFALLGVTVVYNATTQTWTIDFGAAITTTFIGNPDGITFYLVLKDETGNTWGSMYSTTPENTFEYDLILDDVAPVMEAVTPAEGDVYLAGGENFVLTIDALDTNLYSLEIDHSMEGSLPEFTVYADSANPYGSAEAKTAFEAQGVFITYDSVAQVWTIDFGNTVTNLFIANPNGITFYMVLKDLAGNTWGSMDPTTDANTYEYNLIRDDVAPVLVSVTPPHDSTVLLGIGDTFKLTIVADDDNLQKLELDHSMEGTLPEFSVYASESDPYGGDEADFIAAGVTVTYDAATQTWVIDFGAYVSGLIANNGGITFYMVLEDMAGNTWGSMSPTTTANTFKYTVSQDLVAPTIGSGVAKSTTDGNVNLVDGKFTVNQGYVVDTIDIIMSEPVLVEIGTVVTMVGYGPYGTITANTDGVITITPYAGNEIAALIGSFSFTAPVGAITDLSGNPFNGSIGLEVLNVAPVAVNDAYSVAEDGVLTVAARGVLINDTDFDPSILTAVKVTDPANGTLVLNADGSFTYTPAANFNGTDSFTYKANDGLADSNVATVTITVTPVNDTPVAVDDEYEVDEDSVLTIAAPGVLGNDTDIDLDNMVVALVSTVSHGELVLLGDGSFTYTPAPDFYGEDSFVYELVTYPAIQAGWKDTATVTITVNPINDAPVAQSQSVTTPEETAKVIPLVATDIENDSLTYEIVAQPAHGTVALVDDVATYTPALNYTGTDSFTFKAKDTTLDSNVATVTITVTPINDAPVAVDDAYTMAEKETLTIAAPGVLDNDSDVDGDTLTATLVDTVQNGTLTLNADGSFVYTPNEYFNSTDSFTYVASDGTLESELAEVVITVTPVNDWPIANDDSYETVTGVLLDVAAPGVLDNDVLLDPDEVVSILILDAPQHGTLSMNDDGSFTYTPDAGFMGTDTFRYQLNSVQLHAEWSDDALVTIVVKPYMRLFLPIIWR